MRRGGVRGGGREFRKNNRSWSMKSSVAWIVDDEGRGRVEGRQDAGMGQGGGRGGGREGGRYFRVHAGYFGVHAVRHRLRRGQKGVGSR